MSAAAGQSQSDATRVNVVTLGCARNEVDSEELAARLDSDGWRLVADAEDADVIMVNTCGFIEQAKRDSIETLLAAGATGRPVVAVGCLAERYGSELAHELPEATVLGFDDYSEISSRLRDAYHGVSHEAHRPTDRRLMLPWHRWNGPGAAHPDIPTPPHAGCCTPARANRSNSPPDAIVDVRSVRFPDSEGRSSPADRPMSSPKWSNSSTKE